MEKNLFKKKLFIISIDFFLQLSIRPTTISPNNSFDILLKIKFTNKISKSLSHSPAQKPSLVQVFLKPLLCLLHFANFIS